MSASVSNETNTATPTNAPSMTLDVTESAITEIKKFMSSEEGLPESCGTSRSRSARRLLGFSI